MKRMVTGVAGLDVVLNGGLEQGTVIGAVSTDEAYLYPRWPTKNAETPPPYCSFGW